MRSITAAIIFLIIALNARAQELPPKLWHAGYLVTNEGDTARGSLKYDFEANLVQLRDSEMRTITYSSQQLLMLMFFDQYFNRTRTFYALPYRLAGTVKNPVFFEILVEGPITLMSREYLVMQNVNNYNSTFYQTPSVQIGGGEVLTYEYYFLNVEGEIIKYNKKKKELLQLLGKHKDAISKYIKKNKLRADRQLDLVTITNYYNKLDLK